MVTSTVPECGEDDASWHWPSIRLHSNVAYTESTHLHAHARQKDILKSSIQIQFNSSQKQKDLDYQSALSHWCNVTIYMIKLVYTDRDSTYAEKLGMH